jgi:hypothetical protein
MIVDYAIIATAGGMVIAVGWYLAHAILSGAGPDEQTAVKRMLDDGNGIFQLGNKIGEVKQEKNEHAL